MKFLSARRAFLRTRSMHGSDLDADLTRAAATVLVTAEKVIAEDEVRRHPDRTVIPGAHFVYGPQIRQEYLGLFGEEAPGRQARCAPELVGRDPGA